MTLNFDDLLKKGKQSVAGGGTKEDRWKEYVNAIIFLAHEMNALYGDPKKHNLKLELKNCHKCGEATFILAARKLNPPNEPLRFHRRGWQYKKSKYICGSCENK